MKSKQLNWKLASAFCVLIAIIIGVSFAGLGQLSYMQNQTREITEVRWPKVELARQALYFTDLSNRITMEVFMTDDQQRLADLLAQRNSNTDKISAILQQIQAKAASEDEKALLQKLVAAREDFQNSYRTALDLLTKQGDPSKARDLATENTLPKMIAYYNAWTDFVAYQGRQMSIAADSVEANFAAARRQVVGLNAGAALLACAIAVFVTLRMSKEIADRNAAEEKLREAHEQLELRVQQRTTELRHVQQQLLESSRLAGMSEVATGVLHNVGNVLNSVTVSAGVISEKINKYPVANLCRATEMIDSHQADLASFLTTDDKGRKLPGYFSAVAKFLREENESVTGELACLSEGIEHIKQIVQFQTGLARQSTVKTPVDAASVIEEAIRIGLSSPERHGITVVRQVENVGIAQLDKHKILQILINLLTNAKNAVKESAGNPNPQVTIRLRKLQEDGAVSLQYEVADNGTGISAENLSKVFSHGFTTRAKGHGFGLHSAANAATEMGGSLNCCSDGPGHGATFVLNLPLVCAESKAA